MSIIIKGMDMPKSCRTCPLNSAPPNGCLIWTINDIRKDKRNNDCPLVEIPTPHGRLIDKDELLSHIKKDPLFSLVERYGVSGVIESRPTILEEEK